MDYTTIRMLFSKYIANIQSFQLGSNLVQVGTKLEPSWKKLDTNLEEIWQYPPHNRDSDHLHDPYAN